MSGGRILRAQALRLNGARIEGDGTLRIEAPEFPGIAGLILNGGSVETKRIVLDAAETVVFASREGGNISAPIEGQGDLVVTGPGTLRLSGESTFSGSTIVNGGTLVVENEGGSATGEGRVLVRMGATLAGAGHLAGDASIEGALRPDPEGRLRVDGDLRFADQSQFDWNLHELSDGAGAKFGQVEVGGDLTFNGAGSQFQTLQLHFPPGRGPNRALPFWLQSHRWRIARAAGNLDASGLAIQDPRFTAGRFSLQATAHDLFLVYTPAAG